MTPFTPEQIEALAAERDRYKAALEAIENGSVPRPVGNHWFPDKRPSKHDSCIHGMFMWEPCESCYDVFVGSVLRGAA